MITRYLQRFIITKLSLDLVRVFQYRNSLNRRNTFNLTDNCNSRQQAQRKQIRDAYRNQTTAIGWNPFWRRKAWQRLDFFSTKLNLFKLCVGKLLQ